jgi:small GTP-binding protein
MSSTNQSFEYKQAEAKFLMACTNEEKLLALEEMLRTAPKHKSSEKMLANLKTRYIKLKKEREKEKLRKRGGKKAGVKKAEMQAVLVGPPSSGKSSILKILTNTEPKITPFGFTTQEPEPGMLNYENCLIQIVDLPSIGSESFETGIINTADSILLVVERISDISGAEKVISRAPGKKIIVLNKIDFYDDSTKRKITETLKSKRYDFSLISSKTGEGIEELKEKIFKSFEKIRIYTKEPGKEMDKEPVIMNPGSTVEDIAKMIFHGRRNIIKRIRIWGPSSKFGGQEVGIKHLLKDKDIIEFQTK